jgi:hypothetical protein
MKRSIALLLGIVSVALFAGAVVAAAGMRDSDPVTIPDPRIGPTPPLDTGAGEQLLVVLGGVYPTRSEADQANGQMPFGDVAGYYVVPVAQFQGFREQVGNPGEFGLVSVFRTQAGAEEFVRLARGFGYPAQLLASRVRSLGGLYAGLGQEADPTGRGPLLHPIAESLP